MSNRELIWQIILIIATTFSLCFCVRSCEVMKNKYIESGYTQERVPNGFETIWVKK